MQYLDGTIDSTALSRIKIPEPVIQNGDLLSIIVFSDNPQATALYNQPVASVGASPGQSTDASAVSGMGQATSSGYLVDVDGNIFFQGVGKLHVAGLTKPQLIDLLNSKLKDSLLTNPYYNIRFLNYKVTVIGDVLRPGVYSVPTERMTILEALGLAGDITVYGKKDDVLVIREQNGKREFNVLDLTKPETVNSPYYYLQQNDMIIVKSDKRKSTVTDQNTVRNVSIITSIVSAVGIIITIITRL